MRLWLTVPQFRWLWTANLCATPAGWSWGMALSVHVFTVTGSPLATGAVLAANLAPAIALGSLGGAVADRVDRIRLVQLVSWLRALLLAGSLLATDDVAWLLTLAVVQSAALQLFAPAEQAAVAAAVPGEDLPTATAANSAATNVSRLVGPVAGVALTGFAGITAAIGVTTALLVIAAALLTRLRRVAGPVAPTVGFLTGWRLGLAGSYATGRPAR